MKWSAAALRQLALAAAIAAATAACGSGTDVNLETFNLVSVDGVPLPAAYPDPLLPPETFEVTEGRITLNPNGAFLMDLWMRCNPDLPPATECQVTGDGRQPMVGTYSREQGFIQFGSRQYAAAFENNRITAVIQLPPSEGMYPSFTIEFRR